MRYSKIIVALVIALNAVYTAAFLYAFIKVGVEPVALIAAWFAFTGGELWLLADIRKKKIKNKGDSSSERTDN